MSGLKSRRSVSRFGLAILAGASAPGPGPRELRPMCYHPARALRAALRGPAGGHPRPRLSWSARCPERQGYLSQLSHGLDGRYGTLASVADSQQDADLPFWIAEPWPDRLH
jgi:hypothetical protein